MSQEEFGPRPILIILWDSLVRGTDLGQYYSYGGGTAFVWLTLWEKSGSSPSMTQVGREGPALQTEDNRKSGIKREGKEVRGRDAEQTTHGV